AAAITSLVCRITGRERAQAVRREQLPLDYRQHRLRLLCIEQVEGQTECEQLVRANGGVGCTVRSNHVEQAAGISVPEFPEAGLRFLRQLPEFRAVTAGSGVQLLQN